MPMSVTPQSYMRRAIAFPGGGIAFPALSFAATTTADLGGITSPAGAVIVRFATT